ncbi:hypothetical protein ACX93W_11310 [Paenibacillus sp. CAU 1782]
MKHQISVHDQRKFNRLFSLTIVGIIAVLLLASCAKTENDDNAIAILSPNKDLPHAESIKVAGLGHLLDYQIQLPRANESWLRVWLEGYVDGKRVQEDPIWEMSFGNSPFANENGPLGVGFIPFEDSVLVYGYGPSGKLLPNRLPDEYSVAINNANLAYAATEDNVIRLQPDESRIIGTYWQMKVGESLRSADFLDEEDVMAFTREHSVVLLIKAQVTERDSP